MYFEAITQAMKLLAEEPRTLFVGQAVKYPGQVAFKSFEHVPTPRRIEMPVVEDFQIGFCTGLALAGYIPVSFFPRMDFLIIAANQIVNHLDKLPSMGWFPKVIIRTAIGRKTPLDPGPQHTQNHCRALQLMLETIAVVEVRHAENVVPAYRKALDAKHSSIIVEHMANYES